MGQAIRAEDSARLTDTWFMKSMPLYKDGAVQMSTMPEPIKNDGLGDYDEFDRDAEARWSDEIWRQ